MAEDEGVREVKNEIRKIYNRKKRAALALCLMYAGKAIQLMRDQQASSKFWQNQTGLLKDTMFSGVIDSGGEFGWFVAHMLRYGIYVELANNRKHAILLPTIARFYSRFIRDLEEIYGDAA